MADIAALERKFMRAHQAGDTKNAAVFAAEIKRVRATSAVPSVTETPPSVTDRALAPIAGANRAGYLMLPGLPVDTAANVVDLAKAGIGYGIGEATGKPPPAWTEPMNRAAVPGSSAWIERQIQNIGLGGGLLPPRPDDPASRVLAGAGGGALLAAMGRPTAGAMLSGAAQGAAGQIGAEAFPESRVAPIIATLATQGAISGVQSGLRYAARGPESNIPAIQQNIADFSRVGQTPTVGQAMTGTTRAPMWHGAETLLSKTPGAVTRYQNRAQALADALQARAQAASQGRQAGPIVAGRELQRGAEQFTEQMWPRHAALDARYLSKIPERTRFGVPETQATMRELMRPSPESAAVSAQARSPYVGQVAGTVDEAIAENPHIPSPVVGGGMPYRALRRLREDVGNVAFKDPQLITSRDRGAAKQMYHAMTRDMSAAVAQQGPAAVHAFRRANQYLSAAMNRIRDQLDPKIAKQATPENAFYRTEALIIGAKPDLTSFNAIMRSMPESARADFAAAVVNRLGAATFGKQNADATAFSPETFLTNYAKLSPPARNALFRGFPDADAMRSAADDIARVAGTLREGAKVFANPSGTAANLSAREMALYLGPSAAVALGTGHPAAALGLASIPAAVNLAGRAMTSPKSAQWLGSPTPTLAPQELLARAMILYQGASENARDVALRQR